MTQRITRRRLGHLGLGAGAAWALAGTGAADAETGGSILVFAAEAQPPTLDMHFSTAVATRNIALHMFEQLVTRDESNRPIPELAQSWETSPDGLVYRFALRRGIQFHNGKELTSADVLASFRRFQRIGLARSLLNPVAAMEAPDPDSFVLTLKQPVPVLIEQLSQFGVPLVIYPAAEAEKDGGRAQLIGTGPYRFREWIPDSHVRLERFQDYRPDQRYPGPTGFGGRKRALIEVVEFRFATQPGARVAGLETGQFQATEDVPPKNAERLKQNPAITLYPLRRYGQQVAWVNHARPPTDTLAIRRAIQIGLDMEEIMEIANDGAYDLGPGFQYPGNPYYVEDGQEFYNANRPDAARRLMAEAGYKGEEVVLLTNSTFTPHYNAALVMAEQLKRLGFKTRLDVFDWPTATAKQRNQADWNFWFTVQGTGPSVGPFSAYQNLISPQNQAFVPDPVLDRCYEEMITGATLEERKRAFGRFQARVYEAVHLIKFGDQTKIQATRSTVKGFRPFRIPRLWDVSIEG
ncbi:MAG: ABC transporter substrate-binding protein [Proteobacteria bacterium]|nr:ABC transporter substrate-binding protein [Pseudomonadota bacterium]